jgi:hypothetical protein
MENVSAPIPPDEVQRPPNSLAGRLLNIFATPGDVFEGLKTARHAAGNWLVPIFTVTLVVIVSFVAVLSQPAIQRQIIEMQGKAIDHQVAAGRMKPEQARQAKEFLEKIPPWAMQLVGILQGVISGFAGAFWWALVLWLLGKVVFKADLGFLKALEASGLTMMIFALSVVVSTLLAVVFGNIMVRPALSAFLDEFDPTSKVHLLLGSVNLFYLWSTTVLALALSKLCNVPLGKAMAWFFAFWVASRVLFVGIGLGGFIL